jgi:hypothetical protein
LREKPEDVWAEIVSRLRASENRSRGIFSGVHVAPDTSGDIPDEDSARLVILHPSYSHSKNSKDSSALEFASQSLEKRGSAQRINKNMLIYLAADSKGLLSMAKHHRSY